MELKPNDRKVLLIGWDAADWKVMHKLVDEGKMPNISAFMEEGVIGNLATLYPELSPMLWTSIATGKRPFKHGIVGFTEPDPQGGGVRPITNVSRSTKALWNIMGQLGKKSVVVGWWPSHPAEPINGVMVSNHFQRAVAPHGQPWPMRPGTVHPERLVRNLSELRLHPQDLEVELILNFVPKLAEVDQEEDKRIESLAKIIADCTTINRAATAIMLHEPWDFAAIYYDSIDHFGHGFMQYHPPRLSWISEKEFELYNNVVESGYIYHDILLGTLLEQAGPDTTVIIVSDHGFHSDHLRPRHVPIEPAGPAVQHRPYGVFAARGPGIRKDEIIYGASLLDVTPTILAICGLPIGEDMDGKPLVNIFEEPPEIKTIPSWDDVPGPDGMHPPDKVMDPMEAREALNQLVELGYIEKPDENREKAVRDSVRELQYNRARSYMDAGLHSEAIPILEELLEEQPDEYRFGIQLVSCYHAMVRVKEARTILEELFKRKKVNIKKSTKELKEFREKHKDTPFKDLERPIQREFRKLRAGASRNPFAMEYLMGTLLFEEGRDKEALSHLERAGKADSTQPGLYNRLGDVYLRMKRWLDAERNYKKALSIDPENAEAHLGLADSYLKVKKNVDSAEAALAAIGLKYHNPKGHFTLGVALHRIGRVDQAVEALNVALSQKPLYPEVHARLAYIYKNRLNDRELFEKHRGLARESRVKIRRFMRGVLDSPVKIEDAARASLSSAQASEPTLQTPMPEGPVDIDKTIVIVTGLPRTGTSMMMQMLGDGGIESLTDGQRAPDEDNKKGYYEYEKAKTLARDDTWLSESKGKAVKIVAQLLTHLPRLAETEYRVVFMERDMDEVLASQRKMLERKGKGGAKLSDDRLRNIFGRQLSRTKLLLATRKIPTLYVDYNETLKNPAYVAGRLGKFLGGNLDEGNAADAVAPAMKRQDADALKGKENKA